MRGPGGRRTILRGLGLGLVLFVAGCGRDDEMDYSPQFTDAAQGGAEVCLFGVHPLHNPHHLFKVYQPLVDYLNRHGDGTRFRLEASRNYDAFEQKLFDRHFAFALPNPYQTVMSLRHGYRVFGKMANDEDFRGIILVRRDSAIASVADLRGKAISYPAETAVAATLMPQWFLHSHGLETSTDVDSRYVGSQESAIMNVYLGITAAGATWPPPWRAFVRDHPEVAAALEVRWQTGSLPNNGLVVRDDVPEALARRVAGLLFGLQDTEEGRAILAAMELGRFEPADDTTYQPVSAFLARFSHEVRPLEGFP